MEKVQANLWFNALHVSHEALTDFFRRFCNKVRIGQQKLAELLCRPRVSHLLSKNGHLFFVKLYGLNAELMNSFRRHVQGGVSMDQKAIELLSARIVCESHFLWGLFCIVATNVIYQRLQRRIDFRLDRHSNFFTKGICQCRINSCQPFLCDKEWTLFRSLDVRRKEALRAGNTSFRQHDAALSLSLCQLLVLCDKNLQLLKQLQVPVQVSLLFELLPLQNDLHERQDRSVG